MIREKKALSLTLFVGLIAVALSALALMWCFDSIIPAHAAENATVSGFEAQIKDLEAQEEALNKKIQALKEDKSKALSLKLTLDQQLTLTYDKIDVAEALIAELKSQIALTESEIEALNQSIDKQKLIFRDRLRLAYEEGNVSYFAMLFDADGLTEFFNNIDRIGSLLDYDSKIIENYGTQLEELEKTRLQLGEQVAKQMQYQASLDGIRADLIRQQDEVDALLEQISNDRESYEADIVQIKEEAKRLEKELEEYLRKLQEEQNKAYMVEGQLRWPIKDNTLGYNRITSLFGNRDLEVDGNDVSNHKGLDIGVRYVKLYACGKGKVVKSETSKSYGNYIIIDHGGGVSTLYAHLSKLAVKNGQTVEAGQYIGDSGNSGWSNGPHLHLEIRIDGKPCDPLTVRDKSGALYLSRPSNLYSAYPDEFEVPKVK